jgi:hypothetical protein
MKTCFNCGQRYNLLMIDTEAVTSDEEHKAQIDGFCSKECQEEEDKRLVEGNGIIANAELQLSELNTLKLQTSGLTTVANLLRFNNTNIIKPVQEEN